MSALSHDEKQFEKLMHNEAKADQELITMAVKELKKAEKAYAESIKSTAKAERAVSKASEKETKLAKALNKAEHKHKDAAVHREQAERGLEEKEQRKSLESQDVQQRQSQLFDVHRTFDQNERDRIRRSADFRSQNGLEVGGGN